MRYPLNAHSKELASAGEARERERELVRPSLFSLFSFPSELTPRLMFQAKEIEDAEDDGDIDGPGDMEGF